MSAEHAPKELRTDERYSEAFDLIAQLGIALGAAPLSKHTGCWEHAVDERWRVAVNGHREGKATSTGEVVKPFTAIVWFNGWPAGLISPRGGVIAAGEVANEGTLIAALQRALEVANGK